MQMPRWMFGMATAAVVVSAMMFALSVNSPSAAAQGHTSNQLANASWDCYPAGLNDWIHCFSPGSGHGTTLQVKVFGVSGAPFLGTELLTTNYQGQPCSTDDGDLYHEVDTGLFACHHFSTGP
jgi:hypothetical protein